MLELFAYALFFVVGTVLGMYIRRQEVNSFKTGLHDGLAIAEGFAQKQQPRHQNHQPRKDQKN